MHLEDVTVGRLRRTVRGQVPGLNLQLTRRLPGLGRDKQAKEGSKEQAYDGDPHDGDVDVSPDRDGRI